MKKSVSINLNLSMLTATARRLISEYVQTELFKLGYRWASNCKPVVILTNAPILKLEQDTYRAEKWEITYSFSSENLHYEKSFSHNSVDDFLRLAKNMSIRSSELCINGIAVTITPSKIDLNVIELVAKTISEAKKIQAELFGSGLGSSPA